MTMAVESYLHPQPPTSNEVRRLSRSGGQPMALNISIESKPSGRVRVEIYRPDTTPVTAEHLMDRARVLHANVISDVEVMWRTEAAEFDADINETGD